MVAINIRIDYVMRGGAGGWRIVDVLLNGSISRVAVQRSDFRALLESGNPAALIDSLKRKVCRVVRRGHAAMIPRRLMFSPRCC